MTENLIDLLIADAKNKADAVQAKKQNTEPSPQCKAVYDKVFTDIKEQEESVEKFKKHFGL